jgi:type I restriction enzyme S subunit
MKSNFNKIGEHIRLVDERNKGLQVKQLLGLSITKQFIPSVANIIGTDMENYKIIRKNQFACSTMQVRRDKKMPVALLQEVDEAIISQAYPIFEVKDTQALLPEYLMMWFTRTEFDREACFHAVGGVRGSLEWEDFENLQLPIPSINKQREIVQEYNVIQNRIVINQQLIQKLEETAQAIYKQWFVEFEFPDENGKPYKSNNGIMVWNEELQKEIPKGWEVTELQYIIENFDSKRRPIAGFDRQNKEKLYPYYGAAALMDFVDEYIFDGDYILLGEDGSVVTENGTPVLQYVWGKFWVNNHAHVLKGKNGFNENSLYILLKNTNIKDIITGGVQSKINQSNLNSISILKASSNVLKDYNLLLNPIFQLLKNKQNQIVKFNDLNNILLSKLATVEN